MLKQGTRGKYEPLLVMALVGMSLGILLYPAAANWINARSQAEQVTGWAQKVNSATPAGITDLLAAAELYNSRLAAGLEGQQDERDPAYLAQLRKPGTSVISRVVIPSINIALPVFHGTSNDVLEVGAGHLYGTSLPVGNHSVEFGTHAVITAHSGIDTNSLFNDIHDLTYGDLFLIETAGRQLFYLVEQISIVPEYTIKRFLAEPGQDLVTLLTCTPIGINSHRLLVRGTRHIPKLVDAPEVVTFANFTAPGEQFPTVALAWAGPTLLSGPIWHLVTKPKHTNLKAT